MLQGRVHLFLKGSFTSTLRNSQPDTIIVVKDKEIVALGHCSLHATVVEHATSEC